MKEEFQNLYEILNENYLLETIGASLMWDEETYLPPSSFGFRGKQISLISKLAHETLTSSQMEKTIKKLYEKQEQFSPNEQVIIRETYKDFSKKSKIPSTFVEEKSNTIVHAQSAWFKAREKKDFEIFSPWMEKLLNLGLKEAAFVAPDDHPYNVLLDQHETGLSIEKLDPLFKNLAQKLTDMLPKVLAKNEVPALVGPFSEADQRLLSTEIIKDIGFDFEKGRLDKSVHPFMITLGPQDIRITTKFYATNFEGVFSTIHEAGHGLYEQGLNQKYMGTPLGTATSVATHESQSRFWEVFIGKSRPFIVRYFPKFQQFFPQLRNLSEEQFFRMINRVAPCSTRIEADELTYHLHIITRYEIERDLFAGKIKVKELPEVWAQKMKNYLQIEVQNDLEGVLQDIHWTQSLFGYFPTYTLGSIYAAQFLLKMRSDIPDLDNQIINGNFAVLRQWLQKNIFHVGRAVSSTQLIEKITQKQLSEKHLLDHLNNKWLDSREVNRAS